MNYTANYHLTQWEKNDHIMMDDFNENNAKIDAALAEKPFVIGTYTGNGELLSNGGLVIAVGFRPRFVVISGARIEHYARLTFCCGEDTAAGSDDIIAFSDEGFTVGELAGPLSSANYINVFDRTYSYIAFR